ncbi:MAG: hypothetical protein GXZ07_10580 [Firmicutes bacterium]|nr:hypothetical protein [Bacillota bacterium]
MLSTTVLMRLKALLDALERRFDFTESCLPAPRGSVLWSRYLTASIAAARFLEVPCRYPDLRDDRELKAAIHFTLRKQLAALESQRNAGPVVLQVISLCQSLLERMRAVAPKQPAAVALGAWYRGPVRTQVFREGLQAIEWTVDDRGLAGLGDLQGLPWVMPTEPYFRTSAGVFPLAVRNAKQSLWAQPCPWVILSQSSPVLQEV